nr:reverse transcriptase domain-containing protein [Tanacetum cinerariifolium]
MLVDALLQHEVEGRVDRLVQEVEELDSKRAELVDELVINVSIIRDLVRNQGNIRSQNDNAADDGIHEDDRNVSVGNSRNGCPYKDFVACKLKELDGKGGVVAYIRWVEKIEAVQDINGCGDNQKVKYLTGSLTGRALTWCNSKVKTRGHEAAVGMTWEDFKALMKEEYCPTNKMQRLETEFWNHVMVGAGHSSYTDRFHELARLVPHLVTPKTKMIKRYVYGLAPQICGMVVATEPFTIQSDILKARVLTDEAVRNRSLKRSSERRGDGGELNPTAARGACYECGGIDHYKGQGRGNNGNTVRKRAFVMGAKEARQDPNIVTSTFFFNNHYATMLFDSGANCSFVSTTFVPLLDIDPTSLGFSYETEIASRQLVEITKVIRGCKLEIEGHTIDIDLILFGHESLDVIIGIDWLSRHKAKIVCHERWKRILEK